MKQPIKVSVERELGNSGDVIVTMTDAHGDRRSISTAGEQNVYGALAGVRSQVEEVLNEWTEPHDGTPYCVVDPATGDISVMIGGTEITRVAHETVKAAMPKPSTELTSATSAQPEHTS